MKLRELVSSYRAAFNGAHGLARKGCFKNKKPDVAVKLLRGTADVIDSFDRDDTKLAKMDIARLIARLERLYVAL